MKDWVLDVRNAAVPFDGAIALLDYVRHEALDARFEDKAPTESAILHSAAGNLVLAWRDLEMLIVNADEDASSDSGKRKVFDAGGTLSDAIILFRFIVDNVFRDTFEKQVAPAEGAILRSAVSNLMLEWRRLEEAVQKGRAANVTPVIQRELKH